MESVKMESVEIASVWWHVVACGCDRIGNVWVSDYETGFKYIASTIQL